VNRPYMKEVTHLHGWSQGSNWAPKTVSWSYSSCKWHSQ
jgi:hypothetical protein